MTQIEDRLREAARAAFGRPPAAWEQLRGGTKKGVYRIVLDDGTSAVVYSWAAAENHWPPDAAADLFAPTTGLAAFLSAHSAMRSAGVRVPRLHHADAGSSAGVPFAVVEDLGRGSLETLLAKDPEAGTRTARALAAELAALHAVRREQLGRIADPGTAGSASAIVLARTLRDLAEACRRLTELAPVHDELVALARERAAAVPPRTDHRLVHAELGPDHVLIADDGAPVLVDIDGAMFFDLELEHVFLRLRFGEAYHWLARDDLDDARMAFYELAMHISLVAGPLRLLDGDFPHREGMLDIVRWNVQHTLALLRRA